MEVQMEEVVVAMADKTKGQEDKKKKKKKKVAHEHPQFIQ